ncbi:MAG: arylsulfatase [Bacteroidaceae bacterium]|nr:arylsulfatase [Bacteroidaceae bacterium]
MDNSKLLLFGCGLLASAAVQAQEAQKPNIIYIMCDDMGYADLGCYGQQYISTPNLDRMAAQGMRFTQAYAGSPVSAPSRACFMTGQHTGHTKVRGNKEYRIGSIIYGKTTDPTQTGQEPYDPNHIILPEIMKDNGYTTGMFGKWAGGYEGSESTPDKRGIDRYYGFMCQFQAHLYYPNFLNSYDREAGDTEVRREILQNNINYGMHGEDYKNRRDYSADLIHQEAMKWIDKQTGEKPFFGIFTYTLPHAELAQPNDSILQAYQGAFCQEKSYGGDAASRYNPTNIAHQQFAAMVTRLDAYVGEVIAKLEEKGFADNTLVIFTSDNGPHTEGGGDPDYFNTEKLLRGTKRSTTEGGIRVPFIAWWPGKVEAGSVNDHQLAFYDLMPTFCEVAGIDNYVERYTNKNLSVDYFDGLSFAPTLLGKGEQAQHEFLYWEFHETNMMALRMGNWKLVVQNGNCSLYDLVTDTHEDNNLAAKYPEVVKEMKEILLREHTPSSISQFNSITLPQ